MAIVGTQTTYTLFPVTLPTEDTLTEGTAVKPSPAVTEPLVTAPDTSLAPGQG